MKKIKIVIIGATSSIAEHCARLWVQEQPVDLTLVARDIDRVERIAADLRIRGKQSEIQTITANFLDPDAIQSTVNEIVAQGQIDIVLIAHGSLPEQTDCQNDLKACKDTLEINGISPVLYAEAFAMHMAELNRGTIALISSVAGDRGRKSNYVYGSAKGLITRYAQGMQHRFAGTGVNILLIKPGPTDTPMTAKIKQRGTANLASVTDVARDIATAIGKKRATIYTPGKWKIIMMIIQHIPKAIFNKINI